ncbi:MAG: DUF5050 domain-containing protein [Clostridiales bacterium]|nr:DUF5050 domain-containing protein [Clostridiales bacterium]
MKKLSIICLLLAIVLTFCGCASEIVFAQSTGIGANPLNLQSMGLINMDSTHIYYVKPNNSLIKVSLDGSKESKIGGKCYGFININDEFVYFNGSAGDNSGICKYEKATGTTNLVHTTNIETMLLTPDALYFIDDEPTGTLQKYSLDDGEVTVVDENGNGTFLDYCFDKLFYCEWSEQGYTLKTLDLTPKPTVEPESQDPDNSAEPIEEVFEIKTLSTISSAPIKILSEKLVLTDDGYIFNINNGKRYEKVEKLSFDTVNVIDNTLIFQNDDGLFKCHITNGEIEKVAVKEVDAYLYVINNKPYFVDFVTFEYYEAKGDSFTFEKMFAD